jgi:predicted hydrocarbon binding protein
LEKEPSTKGSSLISAMSFISTNLGEPALKSILASFDSRLISGRKLLPSESIPETTYRDLLVAAGKYLQTAPGHRSPKEFFFEMGRFEAHDGINKYYKTLIKRFDTKFMLTKSPLLWRMTHSHGSVKVEAQGKTGAIIYISDYPAPCQEFCYNLAGYMWAVGELTNADMVRVEEVECVTRGAARCKFAGEWKQLSSGQKS